MRATQLLQKCLGESLQTMHALRARVLMGAVEALVAGRRLTLIDLARAWPGAERIRAPLKALDRLLGTSFARRTSAHPRGDEPLVGAYRSADSRGRLVRPERGPKLAWHLLRASIPVGGRTITVLDMVFPGGQQGSPKAEKQFLQQLAAVLPAGVCPIVVTDAGFCAPCFRAVEAMGWHWLGRLRNRNYLKPCTAAQKPSEWVPCKALYELATRKTRDFHLMEVTRGNPITARVVLHSKPPKGRKDRNRRGVPARNSNSRKSASREREPWLLMASPELKLSAQQLVTLYERRMQIELSFRDLKSHRYGQGFEDSLARQGARIEVLLLLSTLAAFATWLVGLACEASGIDQWLAPCREKRRLYSLMRLGRKALVRRWSNTRMDELPDQLRHPSSELLNQLGVPVCKRGGTSWSGSLSSLAEVNLTLLFIFTSWPVGSELDPDIAGSLPRRC